MEYTQGYRVFVDICKLHGLTKSYDKEPEPDTRSEEEKLAECLKECEEWNERELHQDKSIYDCRECGNRGVTYVPERYEGTITAYTPKRKKCGCMNIRPELTRLSQLGVSAPIGKSTFGNFNVTEPWQKDMSETAQRFCKSPDGHMLYIGGQPGCGKTHICAAVTTELLLSGRRVRYESWRNLMSRLKTNQKENERYQRIIDGAKSADILCIDDFLKTGTDEEGNRIRPYGADMAAAYEIINYRYERKMPTVFSTELLLTDLVKFDEALGSRIYELSHDGFLIGINQASERNYRLN